MTTIRSVIELNYSAETASAAHLRKKKSTAIISESSMSILYSEIFSTLSKNQRDSFKQSYVKKKVPRKIYMLSKFKSQSFIWTEVKDILFKEEEND